MAQNVTAQHAEDLITRIFAGQHADATVIADGTRGAIPVYPIGLVLNEHTSIPVRHSITPGVPLPPGVHRNEWVAGENGQHQCHGVNYIVVGDQDAPAPEAYHADGRAMTQVPAEMRNYRLPVTSATRLRQRATQMQHDATAARGRLLMDLDPYIRWVASRASAHDQAMNSPEDVVQLARELAYEVVDKYISPDRPKASLTKCINSALSRDIGRRTRRVDSDTADETVRLAAYVNAQEDVAHVDAATLAQRYHGDKVRAARRRQFTGGREAAPISAEKVAKTERNMERAMAMRNLLAAKASIDKPIDNGDGVTYVKDTIADVSAEKDFDNVVEHDASGVLQTWFAGAGVDTSRLGDLVGLMMNGRGSIAIRDLNASLEADYIRWALTPLRRTNESWDNQDDVNRIMGRFKQMIVGANGPRSEVDIANIWDAYTVHRNHATREAIPNYFGALA